MFSKLSDDVLSSILFRLPAKQVAQIRSISKPWYSFLCQPSFIKSFLHNAIHNDNDEILLMVFSTSFDNRSFTAHPCQSPHLDFTNHIKKLPVNIHSCFFIGSVNGFICFFDYIRKNRYAIHILNPSKV